MSEAKITSIGQTSAVGLFSIIFEGDSQTEFRKFIEKFKDDAVRNLRLYCLSMSDSVLIVGNGGIKNTRTHEQDPELNGYVINLQKLDALLREDIRKGIVVIEETEIQGTDNLTFDI